MGNSHQEKQHLGLLEQDLNVTQLVLVLIAAVDNTVQGLAVTWERLAAGYRSTLLHHPTL